LLGLIDVTLHMLPFVRKAKGRVVNVSSVLGRLSYYGGGYPISKYGVEAFSDSLRQEMQTFGVHVSMVEPGAFSTSIYNHQEESLQRIWRQLAPDIQESYGQKFLKTFCEVSQKCASMIFSVPTLNFSSALELWLVSSDVLGAIMWEELREEMCGNPVGGKFGVCNTQGHSSLTQEPFLLAMFP
ncbi:retinol dehydrogenase 16-like, partial [Python bivittatus]|uniref:Retinol dehydrogenase 16-like n=1 Tax=Python bivittatus TaxID=176946 RepID=A0A9F5IXG6_PYTBI